MITGVEIGFGLKALKSAFDLAKEAKDLTDTTTMRTKIIEMQGLIMDAQSSAIDARTVHADQADRIRTLETEMARLKAWDAEKARYDLHAPEPGAMVYAVKPEIRGGEPPHWLCPNCYADGKKRFLQGVFGSLGTSWKCRDCKYEIVTNSGCRPK